MLLVLLSFLHTRERISAKAFSVIRFLICTANCSVSMEISMFLLRDEKTKTQREEITRESGTKTRNNCLCFWKSKHRCFKRIYSFRVWNGGETHIPGTGDAIWVFVSDLLKWLVCPKDVTRQTEKTITVKPPCWANGNVVVKGTVQWVRAMVPSTVISNPTDSFRLNFGWNGYWERAPSSCSFFLQAYRWITNLHVDA